MPLPDIPIDVDPVHRQVDGDQKTTGDEGLGLHSTHRGNFNLKGVDKKLLEADQPRGSIRYTELP